MLITDLAYLMAISPGSDLDDKLVQEAMFSYREDLAGRIEEAIETLKEIDDEQE